MEHPPSCVVVFLLGVLGALAPETVRLYGRRWRIQSAKFSWGYFVLSGLYALIGGVIAIYLPAVNGIAAIYAGAAWPSIFSTLIHRRGPFEIQAANSKGGKIPRRSLIDLMRDHADLLF